MAGAGKKWLTGCGIGCGLMLLVIGGAGTCAYVGVKKIQEQTDAIDVNSSDLTERFGEPAEFVPSPDGTISSDRMETFLAVRDSMAVSRLETSDILTTLDGDGHWLGKAKAGIKMVPALVRFAGENRRVLLDLDMGVGEYSYIYALSYYVLLAKDPADGPGFSLSDNHDQDDDDPVRVQWGAGNRKGETREVRVERVRRLVNELGVELLNNQIAALQATLPAGAEVAADPWGAQLLAEQQALSLETLRFPWEEGLPDPLSASLEPFRDRLEACYDPMTSAIEILLVEEN